MPQDMTLVIGDKNLSSWSMRAWVALKASGIKFREKKILLDRPDSIQKLRRHSPTGRVPLLIHGKLRIWDSLAICEYLAELVPERNLLPLKTSERALARSYMAEMHSGFHSMRQQLSMNIQLRTSIVHLEPQTLRDISRIVKLWKDALSKSGGPFLFGDFGVVDATFAPVVFRFLSYGVRVKSTLCQRYISRVKGHPAVRAWVKGALKEVPNRPLFA